MSGSSELTTSRYYTATRRRQSMVLTVGGLLLATALVTVLVYQTLAQRAEERFQHETGEYVGQLVDQLKGYEALLWSYAAWIQLRGVPARKEWQQLVAQSKSLESHAGMHGVGISLVVPPAEKPGFEHRVRDEGFPEFSIVPPGERSLYTATLYLEPFTWRNQRAFGDDMYAEPIGRAAMERAALTGTAALSAAVRLKQEAELNPRPGMLLFVPLFPTTPLGANNRLQSCIGWVYAPIRTEEFFDAISNPGNKLVRVEAWTGSPDPSNLLFDSRKQDNDSSGSPADAMPALVVERQFDIAGQHLTLRFSANAGTMIESSGLIVALTLATGLLITGIVFVSMRRFQSFGESEKARADALQKDIRTARQRVLTLIDNLPFAVWMKDSEGSYLVANRFFAQALGRPVNQLIGRSDERIRNNEEQETVRELETTARETRQPSSRIRESHWDDETSWKELTCLPVFSGAGRYLGSVGIERDVTLEHRSAELERKARQAAENASSEKTRFVSMLAHEIRNPLQAAVGCLALLRNQLPDAGQQHLLSAIDTSLLHIRHQLGEAREIARIESGQLEVFSTRFEIATLLDDLNTSYGPLAREKRLLLDTAVSGEVPEVVVGDPEHLYQILSNLVSNGLKYTERGVVSVRAEIGGAPHIVRFVVEDTGLGIPPDLMPRLFKEYSRGHRNQDIEGTGLGLTICQRLISAMHGTIAVKSVPGLGSRFAVEIPFALPVNSDGDGLAMPAPAANALAGCHILLVDDSEITLNVVKELLLCTGATVDTTLQAREAIARIEAAPDAYSAIVTDLRMPGMDGFALGRVLRQRWPGLRVVALSGDIAGDGSQINDLGPFSACLAKPATLAELVAAIRPVVVKSSDIELFSPAGPARDQPATAHTALQGLDENVKARLRAAFFDDQDGSLKKLARLLADGAPEAIPPVAHSIAGAAAFLGLDEIAALTRRLRGACQGDGIDQLSALTIEFSVAIAREKNRYRPESRHTVALTEESQA